MDLIMDGLLMAGTLFAGTYCWILARRVRDLKDLDKGLGGAIVTLTRQIELARSTLDEAQTSARSNRQELAQLVAKAERATGQLRLLLASVQERQSRPELRERASETASRRQAEVNDDVPAARPEAHHSLGGENAPAETPRTGPAGAEPPGLKQKVPLKALLQQRLRLEKRSQSVHQPVAALPQAPARDGEAEVEAQSVPKPRTRFAPEALMRRPARPAEPQNEAELLDALNAIASGTER